MDIAPHTGTLTSLCASVYNVRNASLVFWNFHLPLFLLRLNICFCPESKAVTRNLLGGVFCRLFRLFHSFLFPPFLLLSRLFPSPWSSPAREFRGTLLALRRGKWHLQPSDTLILGVQYIDYIKLGGKRIFGVFRALKTCLVVAKCRSMSFKQNL